MSGPKLGRLRRGTEFDTAYLKGTVINGPLFVVRAMVNQGECDRWGFAVGKRLLPRATDRNRVRRRVREAVRRVMDEDRGEAIEGSSPRYDIVVTAKAPAVDAGFVEMCAALSRALRRVRAIGGAQ